jgi:hypothetical protein
MNRGVESMKIDTDVRVPTGKLLYNVGGTLICLAICVHLALKTTQPPIDVAMVVAFFTGNAFHGAVSSVGTWLAQR